MVYLFYGENSFAMRQKLKELVTRYLEKAGNDFGLERFSAPELDKPEVLINAITAVPFLASSRLVVIEDLTQNKALAESVVASLAQVPETTVVVIYESKPDKRTSAFKQLKEKATKTAEFKPLTPAQLNAWLQKRAQSLGAKLTPATARFLADYAGPNQWRLHHELYKLANYDEVITKETVRELVKPSGEQSIFELIDTLSSGNSARAIALYRKLRNNQEEPHAIIGMLGWHLQNLALAKSAGKSAPELAREAKLSPFVADKSLAQARRMSLASIRSAFGLLLEADLKLKSTAAHPDQVMEELLYSCAQQLAPETTKSR